MLPCAAVASLAPASRPARAPSHHPQSRWRRGRVSCVSNFRQPGSTARSDLCRSVHVMHAAGAMAGAATLKRLAAHLETGARPAGPSPASTDAADDPYRVSQHAP